jgi:hypothetical protein
MWKNKENLNIHQELHKFKNKKNRHEDQKKEWKWNQKKDSFETNKCKKICIELYENKAIINVSQ